jgi:uncharacterized protein (DUF1778 family)
MMDKIYRRPTQQSNTPRKKKNDKNRVRNALLNFRVTRKERELIEARIAATGLTKAEFFIESCLYQAVLVKGNIRSFTILQKKMEEIAAVIDRNPHLEELDPQQAETLRIILEILNARFRKE